MLGGSFPGVQVGTVAAFQGLEFEAVVLSLVRSNDASEVELLADTCADISGAITRARRHVAVVCDSLTFSQNPFLKRLIHFARKHGLVQPASKFTEAGR
jgi:superfamily I DNA and/or RNA helicase